jgi:uncharacterized protein (TIGR00730 family)
MSAPISPFFQRYPQNVPTESLVTPTALENPAFLHSTSGRVARLVAEFSDFPTRVEQAGIRGTFLFFGSARAKSEEQFTHAHAALESKLPSSAEERRQIQEKLATLDSQKWMCQWYNVTYELARMLTEWARSDEGVQVGLKVKSHFAHVNPFSEQPLIVCSGGGPGFMEAANKGSADVPRGVSMGVAVTLPFEKCLNPYVTNGLNFRTEYFFTRKFWEVYSAKAMICAPGGLGTLDETFEVLTLLQCGHCPKLPIVLLGETFWKDVINFEKITAYGVVSKHDLDNICFANDARTAFEHIRNFLVEEAKAAKEVSTPTNRHT